MIDRPVAQPPAVRHNIKKPRIRPGLKTAGSGDWLQRYCECFAADSPDLQAS